MGSIKARFTKWYVRKGYRFGYDLKNSAFWICPLWVRPLLIFFSPYVYISSTIGATIIKGLQEGFEKGSEGINDFARAVRSGNITSWTAKNANPQTRLLFDKTDNEATVIQKPSRRTESESEAKNDD